MHPPTILVMRFVSLLLVVAVSAVQPSWWALIALWVVAFVLGGATGEAAANFQTWLQWRRIRRGRP